MRLFDATTTFVTNLPARTHIFASIDANGDHPDLGPCHQTRTTPNGASLLHLCTTAGLYAINAHQICVIGHQFPQAENWQGHTWWGATDDSGAARNDYLLTRLSARADTAPVTLDFAIGHHLKVGGQARIIDHIPLSCLTLYNLECIPTPPT